VPEFPRLWTVQLRAALGIARNVSLNQFTLSWEGGPGDGGDPAFSTLHDRWHPQSDGGANHHPVVRSDGKWFILGISVALSEAEGHGRTLLAGLQQRGYMPGCYSSVTPTKDSRPLGAPPQPNNVVGACGVFLSAIVLFLFRLRPCRLRLFLFLPFAPPPFLLLLHIKGSVWLRIHRHLHRSWFPCRHLLG